MADWPAREDSNEEISLPRIRPGEYRKPAYKPTIYQPRIDGKILTEREQIEALTTNTVVSDAVAPPEDNPMSWWQQWGAWLISSNYWPRVASSNPVIIYYTGKQKGRQIEDLIGVIPWLTVMVLQTLIYYTVIQSVAGLMIFGALTIFTAMAAITIYSGLMVGFHLRRSLRHFPLEELLVTQMDEADIVQGLSLRPLAVQSACSFFYCVYFFFAAPPAMQRLEIDISLMHFIYVMIFLPAQWTLCWKALELGGVLALRAHIAIPSATTATARFLLDIGRLVLKPLGVGIVGGLLVILLGLTKWLQIGLAAIALTVVITLLVRSALKVIPEAMTWSCKRLGEWWKVGRYADYTKSENEELFTPWHKF